MRAAIAVAKQAKKSPEFFAVLDRQTRKALLPPDTQACFYHREWMHDYHLKIRESALLLRD